MDITERKEMEQQLIDSESRFKRMFTNSPIGIELFDFNGKLIDLNEACLDIFGLQNKSDVIGFDLFNDPNLPENV